MALATARGAGECLERLAGWWGQTRPKVPVAAHALGKATRALSLLC